MVRELRRAGTVIAMQCIMTFTLSANIASTEHLDTESVSGYRPHQSVDPGQPEASTSFPSEPLDLSSPPRIPGDERPEGLDTHRREHAMYKVTAFKNGEFTPTRYEKARMTPGRSNLSTANQDTAEDRKITSQAYGSGISDRLQENENGFIMSHPIARGNPSTKSLNHSTPSWETGYFYPFCPSGLYDDPPTIGRGQVERRDGFPLQVTRFAHPLQLNRHSSYSGSSSTLGEGFSGGQMNGLCVTNPAVISPHTHLGDTSIHAQVSQALASVTGRLGSKSGPIGRLNGAPRAATLSGACQSSMLISRKRPVTTDATEALLILKRQYKKQERTNQANCHVRFRDACQSFLGMHRGGTLTATEAEKPMNTTIAKCIEANLSEDAGSETNTKTIMYVQRFIKGNMRRMGRNVLIFPELFWFAFNKELLLSPVAPDKPDTTPQTLLLPLAGITLDIFRILADKNLKEESISWDVEILFRKCFLYYILAKNGKTIIWKTLYAKICECSGKLADLNDQKFVFSTKRKICRYFMFMNFSMKCNSAFLRKIEGRLKVVDSISDILRYFTGYTNYKGDCQNGIREIDEFLSELQTKGPGNTDDAGLESVNPKDPKNVTECVYALIQNIRSNRGKDPRVFGDFFTTDLMDLLVAIRFTFVEVEDYFIHDSRSQESDLPT